MRSKITKTVAAVAALAAVAFGASALAGATSDTRTSAAGPGGTGAPPGLQQSGNGQRPGRGTFQQATGAAAEKAKAAATAKYPGTVEGVRALPDGSYVVHVIRSNGEIHVHVSKAFTVTGTDTGGPGGPGGPPPTSGSAPQGVVPRGSTPPQQGSDQSGTTSSS